MLLLEYASTFIVQKCHQSTGERMECLALATVDQTNFMVNTAGMSRVVLNDWKWRKKKKKKKSDLNRT